MTSSLDFLGELELSEPRVTEISPAPKRRLIPEFRFRARFGAKFWSGFFSAAEKRLHFSLAVHASEGKRPRMDSATEK